MRIDRAGFALVSRKFSGVRETPFPYRLEAIDARRSGRLKARRRFRFQHRQHLVEDASGTALHAQMAREGPHRRPKLEDIDVDVGPKSILVRRHFGGKPRHFDINQHSEVGFGHEFVGRKAGEDSRTRCCIWNSLRRSQSRRIAQPRRSSARQAHPCRHSR